MTGNARREVDSRSQIVAVALQRRSRMQARAKCGVHGLCCNGVREPQRGLKGVVAARRNEHDRVTDVLDDLRGSNQAQICHRIEPARRIHRLKITVGLGERSEAGEIGEHDRAFLGLWIHPASITPSQLGRQYSGRRGWKLVAPGASGIAQSLGERLDSSVCSVERCRPIGELSAAADLPLASPLLRWGVMKRASAPILAVVGTVAGGLLLYPYAVLVHRLVHIHPDGHVHMHWFDVAPTAAQLFAPSMLPAAAPFALLGLGAGLLVAFALNRTRRLAAALEEARVQKEVTRALERLTVTVAHHVLNANMVISARARRSEVSAQGGELFEDMRVILEESARIDAVVTALRSSAQRHASAYDWEEHMLDLSSGGPSPEAREKGGSCAS